MKSSNETFVEILPIIGSLPENSYVTNRVIDIIQQTLSTSKKVLILYNRRGNARAWVCRDCGFFERCPYCDIALAYHTSPAKKLLCHQCNFSLAYPLQCPKCHGHNIAHVGIGIQQVAETIQKEFPKNSLFLLDSDHKISHKNIDTLTEKSDILLATHAGIFLSQAPVGAVIFLLFEANLSVPKYTIEEELFAQFTYIKKQHIPLYIQTYIPDHPLLDSVLFGNYKSYLVTLKQERQQFSYPPFVDFVIIYIHHKHKETVQQMMQDMMRSIEEMNVADTFVAAHHHTWERYQNEWAQHILLKGAGVLDILEQLETVIVRSRSVFVAWQ